jgi:soluble lytic murein transglycosylase-like protein
MSRRTRGQRRWSARAALAQSNAPALSNNEVCTRLIDVARANALPVGFFTNLIWRESKFDHEAISRAGAMGIAQFVPDVAEKLGFNAFDARDALPASGQLLRTTARTLSAHSAPSCCSSRYPSGLSAMAAILIVAGPAVLRGE